jgi:hypothetical protein
MTNHPRLGSAFRFVGAPKRVPRARSPKNEEDAWLHGFGLALAEVNRHYQNVTAVTEVMRDAGVTPGLLQQAGLEDYDLNEIKKCWRERGWK